MIPALWAVTPGRPDWPSPRGRGLGWLLQAMARAGLPAVIVREPELEHVDVVALTRELAPLFGPGLVLHARCEGGLQIAEKGGFGLHLPAGADAGAARGRVRGWLGMSCHSKSELQAAEAAGCDYALLSPIFQPSSKPDDTRPVLGLHGLGEALRSARTPVLALGGIDPERAAACMQAGAMGVACLGGLFPKEADPELCEARVAAYRTAMRR